MSAFLAWLSAFAVTQIVEVPIYFAALRRASVPSPSGSTSGTRDTRETPGGTLTLQRLGIAFGASLLTHPIVWFVIPRLWHGHSYIAMCVSAELFAWLAEAFYFERVGLPRPFSWSFIANMASVAVGLGLRSTIGWP